MRKRIIALAMTAVLIVSFVGCNSAVDDVSTNVPTQEITEENNVPESNPTSVPTEIPTSVPTDDSESATQEPTPTLSLEVTKIPHSILTSTPSPTKGVDEDEEEIIPTAPIISDDKDDKNDTTIKDDVPNFDDGQEATPTPSVSEAPSPTPQVSEGPKATSTPTPTPKVEVTPTKKPTSTPTLAPTSTPTPTPKPIITPNVGDDKGETIKLESLGISIPKRDEFNEVALKKDSTWLGREDKSVQELIDTLDSVTNALEEKRQLGGAGQSFLIQDNVITFNWYQFDGIGDFSLVRKPSEGYYELSINVPLDYYKNYLGADVTQSNHEVLKTILSVVSSTPNEVFEYLYEGIVNDGSIITTKSYTKVGDCAIRWNNDESYIYDGGYSLIFEIKSSN